LAFAEKGDVVIEVLKGGQYDPSGPGKNHQVDGLSGATITTRGVSNLVRYWLGPDGFGAFLGELRKGA
jgi:Na+-transporting NADH:ubiquinone oxidoreductase subunit C